MRTRSAGKLSRLITKRNRTHAVVNTGRCTHRNQKLYWLCADCGYILAPAKISDSFLPKLVSIPVEKSIKAIATKKAPKVLKVSKQLKC